MTDTPPQANVEVEDEEEIDELLPDIYVETATSLIYEVRFFDTFVIVRPATPAFYLAIRKLTHTDFSKLFEEFNGDKDEVRAFIKGMEPNFVIEV